MAWHSATESEFRANIWYVVLSSNIVVASFCAYKIEPIQQEGGGRTVAYAIKGLEPSISSPMAGISEFQSKPSV